MPSKVGATILVGVVSTAFLIWASAKIFRIGVLMYGKPPTRDAVRVQLDAIIGDVVPEVSTEQLERMMSEFNSV